MSKESRTIEEVLLKLTGRGSAELAKVEVLWQDQHILSLRWQVSTEESGSAKVLKLEQGGWIILSREI